MRLWEIRHWCSELQGEISAFSGKSPIIIFGSSEITHIIFCCTEPYIDVYPAVNGC